MKNTSLLFLFLLVFCGNLTAQSLTITQGNKEKTFKKDSFFEIYLNDSSKTQIDPCCGNTSVFGKIVEVKNDSITMNLFEHKTNSKENGESFQTERYINAGNFRYTFAADDMINLMRYKSKEAKKKKRGFRNAGGLILFTGLTTGVVSFLADKDGGRNKVLLASAVQLGMSFTFIKMGNRKHYNMKKDRTKDVWRVKM